MLSFINRCKDCSPKETIEKARSIISNLNLMTSEQWFTPVSGLYSLQLSLIGTSIRSNGKGSTPEFALASAYGELLERIQNLVYFRISHYSDCYTFNTPFRVSKDEIITDNVCELPAQEKFFRMVIKDDWFECIHAWDCVYKNRSVVSTRFKNLMDPSDELLVPELPFCFYYGSNGMAGGNTYSEAFVQALSEVFERYAVKRIINDKLTPPDITEYIVKKYPEIRKIIEDIQMQSIDITIRIKDISLGLGLPVFAAVYIDKSKSEYFVNFGCHPNIIVAIERSLTELYQGQTHVKVNNATSINQMIVDKAQTITSIFSTGEGAYPIQFFGKNESYKKLDIEKFSFENNSEMFHYFMDIINSMGLKLYYQDAGFLGFPTVSVIIPGISEIAVDTSDTTAIIEAGHYMNFLGNYKSIDLLSDTELISLAQFLEDCPHRPSTSINEVLRVPIDLYHNPHFDDITIDLFLSMIYIRLKKYEKAKKHLDNFIKYMRSCEADDYSIQYNLIISSILRCRIENMKDSDIINSLSDFFPVDDIKSCIKDTQHQKIFAGLPRCNCPHCDLCEYNQICHFSKDNEVLNELIKIKNTYDALEDVIHLF